jgi:hypothetical protein
MIINPDVRIVRTPYTPKIIRKVDATEKKQDTKGWTA